MQEIPASSVPTSLTKMLSASQHSPDNRGYISSPELTIICHFGIDPTMDHIPGFNHWIVVETAQDVTELLRVGTSGGVLFINWYSTSEHLQGQPAVLEIDERLLP